jgi:hypothetical protein
MGLRGPKSASVNANIYQEGTPAFPAPPPHETAKPTNPSVKKTYGAKVQYANPPDEAPALDKAGKRFIQEVTGVFLFLARAVDGTMLTAYQLWALMSTHFLRSFFGDWYLQRFLSVVSV